MGKYNFSAQRFMEIEKRLGEIERENAALKEELAKAKTESKPVYRRKLMNDLQNTTQAKILFEVKPTADNRVVICKDEFQNNFNTFYQNIFRALDPVAVVGGNRRSVGLRYRPIMDLSEEEYKIFIDVLDKCIEEIAYGKTKLSNLRNGKAVG